MTLRPILFFFLAALLFLSCKKSVDKQTPLITTTELEAPGDLSIIAGGRIYEEGGDEITEVGVCWTKSNVNPTLADQQMKGSKKDGLFSCRMEQLDPFTNYNVCAYATNKYGTTYGTTERINSGAPPQPPTLITQGLQKLSTNSVSFIGLITSPLKQVKESGICWNTSGNPSVSDNRQTSSTFSNSSFTCTVEGLQPNTIIYAKPYAKSAGGTSYGALMVVRTYYGTVNDHEGNTYYTTLINGKEWMAENMRCKTFTNGENIPLFQDDFSWYTNSGSAAYCYNTFSATASNNTGLFYNSYVTTGPNTIAPAGWHVPSKSEYENLVSNFDFSQPAGACLRRSSPGMWIDTFTPFKLTGFDAKLEGMRSSGGYYYYSQNYSYFATSTIYSGTNAYAFVVNSGNGAYSDVVPQLQGCSVRCVKD
jgi:uncharacterized protein (TIGR02145 family)